MKRQKILAIAGVLLIMPSLLLVVMGLSGSEVPKIFDSPFVILGGLGLALALNIPLVASVNASLEDGNLAGHLTLKLKDSLMNLGVIGLDFALLGTITLYLFLENFQPR